MRRVEPPSQLGNTPATPTSEAAHLRRLLQEIRIIEERPTETLIPRLWSAKAIAARWNLHPLTIRRAHHAGRLPGHRVLGTLRFLEADVIRLLREEGVPVGTGGECGGCDGR